MKIIGTTTSFLTVQDSNDKYPTLYPKGQYAVRPNDDGTLTVFNAAQRGDTVLNNVAPADLADASTRTGSGTGEDPYVWTAFADMDAAYAFLTAL
jgi:hypothetical protein